jgi:hypothetical protein
VYKTAPDEPWQNGTAHIVTTLLPTAAMWMIDGFDEMFPGAEDTEAYVKLNANAFCGIVLHEALFRYTGDGQRGRAFRFGDNYHPIMNEIRERYGKVSMGCCGDDAKPSPDGRQPGDVLAMALWHGNRAEYSPLTGRKYPRATYGRQVWVDPRDAANGKLWRVIDTAEPVRATVNADNVDELIAAMGWRTQAPVTLVTPTPNVKRLTRLARKALAVPPVFVMPDKAYPSYADFWTLVSLAGFDIRQMSAIDLDDATATYVFVTPEPLPDVLGAKARCIAWLLEYAGDYVQDVSEWHGELWASDKAYADKVGAKFVLLGSDPRLRLATEPRTDAPEFDVTMLGYITPRRQAVKDELAHLKWATPDYPGNGVGRHTLLENTRLVLHIHQHDDAPYAAPLRYAVAAAYRKQVVSEPLANSEPYRAHITFADREHLRDVVSYRLSYADDGTLYTYLCVERPFADCVEGALDDTR